MLNENTNLEHQNATLLATSPAMAIYDVQDIWVKLYRIYFFGVIANALICFHFLRSKNKPLTTHHYLIAQLGIVDLLTCAFLAPTGWNLDFLHPIPVWMILGYVDTIASLSCWFLVLLSYERYRNIVHPFKKKVGKKTFATMSLAMVIFFVLAYSIHFRFVEEIFIYFERIFFHVFLEVVFPITLMLYFYHQIGKEIVKQATITKNLPPYLNRKKRALATLRSLIFIYTICIVPARVVKFTIRFISIARQLPPEYFYIFNHIYNAANFTFYINNMVNIFVYTRMFGDFRKFLVDIVTFSCISKRRITI